MDPNYIRYAVLRRGPIYRFTCACSGAVEDHELVMVGYEGLSWPPVWVDRGSHYLCERCGRKRAYVPPPPPPPPEPVIITLKDDDATVGETIVV